MHLPTVYSTPITTTDGYRSLTLSSTMPRRSDDILEMSATSRNGMQSARNAIINVVISNGAWYDKEFPSQCD